MRKFTLIAFSFVLQSCASTAVTADHWKQCELTCEEEKTAIAEACVSLFKGRGCSCESGNVYWADGFEKYPEPAVSDSDGY